MIMSQIKKYSILKPHTKKRGGRYEKGNVNNDRK